MRAEQPSSPGANWLCGKRAEPSGPPPSGALHPLSMTLLKSTGPLHPCTPNQATGNLLSRPQLRTFCLARGWWNLAVSHLALLFVQRRAMEHAGLWEFHWIFWTTEMWSKPPLNGKAEAQRGQEGSKGAEPQLRSPALHPPGLPGHPPGLSQLPQFYSTQWTELPTRSQAPWASSHRWSCFPGTPIPDSAGVSWVAKL